MASSSASLEEYLKKYQSGTDDKANKKKKKRKEKPNPVGSGVLVVDEDPVWQKPIENEREEEESGEDLPLVEEDIEVKRLKRLQALRAQKPYHKISEDGSGWVSISDQPKTLQATADRNYDLSPPRQQRPRVDTPSPHRGADDSGNGDLSPPRRCRRLDTLSPEKEARAPGLGEVDDDLSPPRRNRSQSPDADLSPPRRSRKGSADDLSPPRRNRNRDMSPPRRSISQMPKDLSPPRTNRNHEAASPPRRMRNRSTESDLSPPRKTRKGQADEVSLIGRSGHRTLNESSESDLSPPRRREEAVLTKKEDLPPPRRRVEPSVKEVRKTGLLTAKEIKEENEKRRKEEISRFAAMDPSISGKGAEPVFRDRKGKRISREELLEAQEKKEEEKKSKENKLEWGKGLAQKREAEARAQELEFEKDKPFARSRDDPELDKMLKERVRWGDPMAHLVKGNTELILKDLGRDEKMKESGFIIPQTIPSHSWIKRGIDFPPNRYGIRPGRHWDGVDRSNGYRKELFKRQNEKRATEAEAYLWSVSDM